MSKGDADGDLAEEELVSEESSVPEQEPWHPSVL